MNKELFEPIITEYDGIQFRSKSEAIFARNLTLRGFWFEYEPRRFKLGSWVPDFFVVFRNSKKRIATGIIEYKPSIPTATYFDRIKDIILKDQCSCMFDWFIACGNAYGEKVETYQLIGGEWEPVEEDVRFFSHIDESSRFRFDLQHTSESDTKIGIERHMGRPKQESDSRLMKYQRIHLRILGHPDIETATYGDYIEFCKEKNTQPRQ